MIYVHAIGKLNELELTQIENHMSIVHGIALQLMQIASRVEQIILIIDLKGIKVKTFSNKIVNNAVKKLIALFTQYFPEVLHKGYIVNAPMAFSQYWSTLEALIPAETRSKFKVTGSATDPGISLSVFLFIYFCIGSKCNTSRIYGWVMGSNQRITIIT